MSSRSDRLPLVIRLRKQREQEHLVARAAAQRRAAVAQSRISGLLRAMDELHPAAGSTVDAQGLQAARLGALGLADSAVEADRERRSAERAGEQAEQQRQQAAIARRSVERLQQRRELETARDAQRQQARRDDEVALTTWRRSR